MAQDKLLIIALASAVLLAFCALPPIVAWARGSPDRRTIAKLAPLGLLSFALWFALIIWGASGKRNDGVISQYIAKVQQRGLGIWVIGALVAVGLGSAVLALALR